MKLKGKKLNELVIQYQTTPTDEIELIIWNSITTLVNYTIFGTTSSREDIIGDLQNDSYITFKRSLKGWDPSRGIDFASYAMQNIKQTIGTSFNMNYHIKGVKMPHGYRAAYSKNEKGERLRPSEKHMLTLTATSIDNLMLNSDTDDSRESILPSIIPTDNTKYSSFRDIYYDLIKPLLLKYRPPSKTKTSTQPIKEDSLLTFEMYSGLDDNYYSELNIRELGELTGTTKQAINQSIIKIKQRIKQITEEYPTIKLYIDEL